MARRLVTGREALLQPLLRKARGLVAELGPEALDQAGLVLETKIKEQLSHPGSGRIYKSRGVKSALARKGTKRRAKQLHQASAPGEPPAPDIGELRRTIGREPVGDVLRVGSPLPQAAALDRGAIIPLASGGFAVLRPRPFMAPALAAARQEMGTAFAVVLRAHGEIIARPD